MNNVADKLYNILGTKFDNTDIKTLDAKGKETTDMEEIEMFSFDFLVNSKNYGPVVILLSANENLEVYYGDNTSKSLDPDAKKKWENLIEHLSTFARTNRLGFSLKHTSDLKYDLSNITDITESFRNIFEGYYGTKKTSYSPQGKAKIIIKHSKAIGEDDKRFRNISSLFIENVDGERFKLPFKKLAGARAMARHVTEGGNPYDLFGVHISEMVNDINTLGGFVRRSKMYEGNDEAMGMVETGRTHYNEMRKNLKRISGVRGYQTYKESWEPSEITEQDTDTTAIRNMFMDNKVNQRTEDALPLLARLQQMAEGEYNDKIEDLKYNWNFNKDQEKEINWPEEKTVQDTDYAPHDLEQREMDSERDDRHEEYYDEAIDWPEEVKSQEHPGDTHPDQDDWEANAETISDEEWDDRWLVDEAENPFNRAKKGSEYNFNRPAHNDKTPCPTCNGTGMVGNSWCPDCDGSGLEIDNKRVNEASNNKPTEVDLFKKIKNYSLVALKGYARAINMPRDIVDQRDMDEDRMIDEIMGYLFDDDWEIKLIKAGAFNEEVVTEQYEEQRTKFIMDFMKKNNSEYDTMTLGNVVAKCGFGAEESTIETLLNSMAEQGLIRKTGTTNRLGSGSVSFSTWALANSGDDMKEITEFEQWADKIVESPGFEKELEDLKAWMDTEQPIGIDAMNATDALENILGNDELYDILADAAIDDPDIDARPIVKNFIFDMYKNLDNYNESDQANIVALYKAMGGEAMYPHEMEEGFDQDLDADNETHLNASFNKDMDNYIQKEDASADEYANSNVWNESDERNKSQKEEDKYKEELDDKASGKDADVSEAKKQPFWFKDRSPEERKKAEAKLDREAKKDADIFGSDEKDDYNDTDVDESLNESTDLRSLMKRTNFLLRK